jgi:hypothetical protein
MRYSYSEPKQMHTGLWRTVVTSKEGRTIMTVEKTTKKDLKAFIKNHKKELL